PARRNVAGIAEKIAAKPVTVLITGESGTGKEMLARYVHEHSDRRSGPFVAVNLPAVPESLVESQLFGHEKGSFTGATKLQYGKFELASGGTLFLDEIGELKLDVQAKLLRALRRPDGPYPASALRRRRPAARDVRLAGEHPRAAEPARADGSPVRVADHRGERPAARVRGRRRAAARRRAGDVAAVGDVRLRARRPQEDSGPERLESPENRRRTRQTPLHAHGQAGLLRH